MGLESDTLSDWNSFLSKLSMTQHFPFALHATPNTHIYSECIYLICAGRHGGPTISYELLEDVAVYPEEK